MHTCSDTSQMTARPAGAPASPLHALLAVYLFAIGSLCPWSFSLGSRGAEATAGPGRRAWRALGGAGWDPEPPGGAGPQMLAVEPAAGEAAWQPPRPNDPAPSLPGAQDRMTLEGPGEGAAPPP